MNEGEKPFLILTLVTMFAIMGCAPDIPLSQHPLEMGRSFNASFEETWNAVFEIIGPEAVIIEEDKASGLIVYKNKTLEKSFNTEVYVNVYVRVRNDSDQYRTTVYFTPHVRRAPYSVEIEKGFFNKLEKALAGG